MNRSNFSISLILLGMWFGKSAWNPVFAQSEADFQTAHFTGYSIDVSRLPGNPILHPAMTGWPGGAEDGANINGPSLIRVPVWVENPLGRYYLYFAHHHGRYIRLAYADSLQGPWTVHNEPVLPIESTPAYSGHPSDHLASPDVHVDEEARTIRMYYHQRLPVVVPGIGRQGTFLAESSDGRLFQAGDRLLGPSYFRVFTHDGGVYAFAKNGNVDGVLLRSEDGGRSFTPPGAYVHHLPQVRHVAVWQTQGRLILLYTRMGDAPERILAREFLTAESHWREWTLSDPVEVLAPETEYEGAALPVEASASGAVKVPVRQLRDPAVHVDDDGRAYLLYSVAGEQGIAIARIRLDL